MLRVFPVKGIAFHSETKGVQTFALYCLYAHLAVFPFYLISLVSLMYSLSLLSFSPWIPGLSCLDLSAQLCVYSKVLPDIALPVCFFDNSVLTNGTAGKSLLTFALENASD